jgi:putative nucleotidyltransferase with HDIG domain
VQRQCDYVFVDVSQQNRVNTYVTRGTAYTKDYLDKVQPPSRRGSFAQEIHKAEIIHQKTSQLIKSFMDEVKLGGSINGMLAKKAVSYCVESLLNCPDALMLMTQLKNRDEYTAQHSMNVCIYAIALGRQINLTIEELNNVGLCGMLHDIGKMQVPDDVLNKPGSLTPPELQTMQSHTVKGWQILMHASGMYPGAIDVAYMHHERLDGKGYPRHLKSEQIPFYTRMIAIVDTYDAITSDRVYQEGRSHLEAIKVLTDISLSDHIDSALTMKFIECLGIYPAGMLVELGSGQVALVLEVNHKAKLKPKILMLLDAHKQPCNEFMVDLSMVVQNTDGQQYAIKRVMRPSECGIDLVKYYQRGLLQRGWSHPDP